MLKRMTCLGMLALSASGPAAADVQTSVQGAAAALANAVPVAHLSKLELLHAGGCTVGVRHHYIAPFNPTRVDTVTVDFSKLDFRESRISVDRSDPPFHVITIPEIRESFTLRAQATSIEPDASVRDSIRQSGGTCDGTSCRTDLWFPFFQVRIVTDTSQNDAEDVLAALQQIGAACGAPGT